MIPSHFLQDWRFSHWHTWFGRSIAIGVFFWGEGISLTTRVPPDSCFLLGVSRKQLQRHYWRNLSVRFSVWVSPISFDFPMPSTRQLNYLTNGWDLSLQVSGHFHTPVGLPYFASGGLDSPETLWFSLGPSATSIRIGKENWQTAAFFLQLTAILVLLDVKQKIKKIMCNGIRHGCLISALLFKFVIKILAKQFKNNNDINGLSSFEKKTCFSQR